MTTNPNLSVLNDNFDNLFEEVDENSLLLEKQALEQQAAVHTDPDDFIFRTVKTSTGKNFTFFHQDEEGKDTNVEALSTVFAFRGVPLKFRFGFSLYDPSAETTACRTTGIALASGGRIDSSHPMSQPIYSPATLGENARPNTPRSEVLMLNPQGSRGKSCAECVQAGEHILVIPHESGDPQQAKTNYCGLQSSVLFCVFQVGIINPEMRNGSPYDNIVWKNPEDVTNAYGVSMFSGPFIVNFRIPRKAATCRISSRSYQPLLDPFNATPSSVRTTSQFIQAIRDEGLVKPMKIGGNDELLYMAITEVWAGRPRESCSKSFEKTGAVPLWSLMNNDPMFKNDPGTIQSMVKSAWGLYVGTKNAGRKASATDSENKIAAGTPTPQVAPASQNAPAHAPAQQTPIMSQEVTVESTPVTQPVGAATAGGESKPAVQSSLSSIFNRNDSASN